MSKITQGPKLNRDWVGLRVRLLGTEQNRMAKLAKGTTGVVDGYSNTGIKFLSDKCEHCGVQIFVSRMTRYDFDILTPPEEWPDTRGNPPPRRRW